MNTKITKTHWLIWGSAIIAIFIGLFFYWQHEQAFPSTDDAYVQAHVVNIAAQVTGPVDVINIKNNQSVTQGQLLFSIDNRPFKIALASASANLDQIKHNIKANEQTVAIANAALKQRQAQLVLAQKDTKRTFALVKQKLASEAEGDQAESNLKVAESAVIAAQKSLQQAIAQLGNTGPQNAGLRIAQAAVDKATLELSYCIVKAPTDGNVTQFSLRPGSMIEAGQPLFSIIASTTWWVAANYKETDLARIKPSQKATITLDLYPDHTFHGHVDSISFGSGAAFALLPPENATGNWVKVTQRFPVRVDIDDAANPKYPLRLGASATVAIDTKQ